MAVVPPTDEASGKGQAAFVAESVRQAHVMGVDEAKTREVAMAAPIYWYWPRSPKGVVPAVVYVAGVVAGTHRTMRQIGKELGVSEAVLRKRYMELARLLPMDVVI